MNKGIISFFNNRLNRQGRVLMAGLAVCVIALLVWLFVWPALERTGVEQLPEVQIYVSPDGSDMNDGSLENPFQTLIRAQDEVRVLLAAGNRPVTVNLRGGEYVLMSPLELTEEDSGSEGMRVTWQAYEDEPVLLSGSVTIPKNLFVAADAAMKERMGDSKARETLLTADLTGFIDEWPEPIVPGTVSEINNGTPRLFAGDIPLVFARWPNDDPNEGYLFADFSEWLQPDIMRITSEELATRALGWDEDAWKSAYFYGYVAVDWFSGLYRPDTFDAALGTISARFDPIYGLSEYPRFYITNIPEEIDRPGEFSIDRENLRIYLYPPEGFEDQEVRLSLAPQSLIQMIGTKHVMFSGLKIGYCRKDGIETWDVDDIVIDRCEISHTTGWGIKLDKATNCVVRNSHVYDTALGGVYLWDGGLRKTLAASGNIIENNDIHHTSQTGANYASLIAINSVGTVIRGNRLHDSIDTVILLTGSNDTMIEDNEIFNAGLETSDIGAIYLGRDIGTLGIVISRNYFHDIGNTYGGYGQQAVFVDDGSIMPLIEENLFVNASGRNHFGDAPIKGNGAQFGVVRHNIFVDAPAAAYFGSWPQSWDRVPIREDAWLYRALGAAPSNGHNLWERLMDGTDFFSYAWKKHYQGTQWERVWEYINLKNHNMAMRLYAPIQGLDQPNKRDLLRYQDWGYKHAPQLTNQFYGNVLVNVDLEGMVYDNAEIGVNLRLGKDIFRNSEEGDYTLTEEALRIIRREIPAFDVVSPK